MANYAPFWPRIVNNEGYFSNAAGDTGGRTFIGISENNYPNWPGWPIINSLESDPNFPHCLRSNMQLIALAEAFYKPTFWDALLGDQITNQSIAEFLADWGINAGSSIPVKHAQTILGVTSDGKMGPATLAALNAADGPTFFTAVQAARKQFYLDVVPAHPADKQFLGNWLERTASFKYAA